MVIEAVSTMHNLDYTNIPQNVNNEKSGTPQRAVKATTPPRVRWPDTLTDSEFNQMCAGLNMGALLDDLRRLIAARLAADGYRVVSATVNGVVCERVVVDKSEVKAW